MKTYLKHAICYLLILSQLISPFHITQPKAATSPGTSDKAYVVLDANSGKIIYSHNPDKRIYPASTTKALTAMVALDYAKPSDKITFTAQMQRQMGAYAAQQHVSLSQIAHLNLAAGSTYTVEQYLKMLLLYSDADSAVALAIGTAGSIDTFAKRMNKKAKDYGMKHSTFDNPVGFDRGKGSTGLYTTASDFAVMAQHAMTYPTIRKIVCKKSCAVTKARSVSNKNRLAGYKNKNYQVIGLKTGTSTAAGHVLITVAKDKKGHEVVCAFFGNSSEGKMYSDIRYLLDYTFSQNKKGKIHLSKGFWDCRFRASTKLVNRYANKGIIKGNDGRFYPDKAVTPKELKTDIKKIAGVKMTFSGKKKVTISQFVKSYRDTFDVKKEVTSSEEVSSTETSSNSTSAEEPETVQTTTAPPTTQSPPIDAETQLKTDIKKLKKLGIFNKHIKTNPDHAITREEAIFIAENLRKK